MFPDPTQTSLSQTETDAPARGSEWVLPPKKQLSHPTALNMRRLVLSGCLKCRSCTQSRFGCRGAKAMSYERRLVSNGNPMEEIVGFSRAVRVGPFIAVGGIAPVDANRKTVGVGDVFAQTTRCFEIIEVALVQAGSGMRILCEPVLSWPISTTGKAPSRRARPIARPLGSSTRLWRLPAS